MQTHEVFNQAAALQGVNLWQSNRPMREALHSLAPALLPQMEPALAALGQEMGSATMLRHARLANTHAPVLHTHNRTGVRSDEVEFHPSYHALLGSALRHGLHAAPWGAQPNEASVAGAHLLRAAGFMLFTECEPSVLCPVSMSYAVAPALRGNAAIAQAWMPTLAAREYDERFMPFEGKTALTMGMGMTEKQGGSDVRANTTRAEADGEDAWGRRYRLTGHKWFFSAPMCDAFLVLARTGELGQEGISCFFMPRWLPDSSLNTIRIQRLKHKLGNQANASSEVEFERAAAWMVGEPGRGIAQILEMGALTRLDCALGTAGLMRQALSIAVHHASQRKAFGKHLIEQPLMQSVLADMALESEAATALALRLALAVDRTESSPLGATASGPTAGSESFDHQHERVMRRLLTPVAKFWICKRGSGFAQEAMECLGGNGYVEAAGEGVMARIYREMPLNSIWEGAGNIMALDLLRALRGADVVPVLEAELASARRAHPAMQRASGRLFQVLEQGVAEPQARELARDVALVLQAALLQRTAPAFVFEAFCEARLAQASDVYGALGSRVDAKSLVARANPVH